MEFEDMKVIWDTQNDEPLYAVNEEGLQTLLRKRAQEFKRLVFWQEAQTYGSTLVVVGMISLAVIAYFSGLFEKFGLTRWDVLALFVGAGCWVHFAASVYFGRKRHRNRKRESTSSLRGEIERDLENVEYEINSRKHLIRGFIPPYVGMILVISVLFRAANVPALGMVFFLCMMIAGLVFETNSQKRLVTKKLIPRKEELESIKEKLVRAEQ